jgi:heparin binding hemagglutinin HbhA
MPVSNSPTRARLDLRAAMSDPKPLYAVVGAGDLAIAALRSVRAEARQDHVRALPSKAQAVIEEVVSTAVTSASFAYGELAGRGRSLVTRVRHQQATEDLDDQTQATVAKVKAASTTVKRSAAAARTSAKSTTTTTKKSAARTKTAAKSATTSAKRSAGLARKAANDASKKVGA